MTNFGNRAGVNCRNTYPPVVKKLNNTPKTELKNRLTQFSSPAKFPKENTRSPNRVLMPPARNIRMILKLVNFMDAYGFREQVVKS